MTITVDEVKQYLRVDYSEDDSLIEGMIAAAKKQCMDILRTDDEEELEAAANGKLFSEINRYTLEDALVEVFYNLQLADESYETIPMGIFEVSEANRTM